MFATIYISVQTLDKLQENQSGVVVKIDTDLFLPFRRRFYELGICAGATIKVAKISPGKNTLLVEFNNTLLTIQKEFAKHIFVLENL